MPWQERVAVNPTDPPTRLPCPSRTLKWCFHVEVVGETTAPVTSSLVAEDATLSDTPQDWQRSDDIAQSKVSILFTYF